MKFIPYKLNEVISNSFYQIPKELFTSPYYYYLSNVSKLLYGLLLDRLSLSMKNNYVDENGNNKLRDIIDKFYTTIVLFIK